MSDLEMPGGKIKLPDDHLKTLIFLVRSGRLGIYTEHLALCAEELAQRRAGG